MSSFSEGDAKQVRESRVVISNAHSHLVFGVSGCLALIFIINQNTIDLSESNQSVHGFPTLCLV